MDVFLFVYKNRFLVGLMSGFNSARPSVSIETVLRGTYHKNQMENHTNRPSFGPMGSHFEGFACIEGLDFIPPILDSNRSPMCGYLLGAVSGTELSVI